MEISFTQFSISRKPSDSIKHIQDSYRTLSKIIKKIIDVISESFATSYREEIYLAKRFINLFYVGTEKKGLLSENSLIYADVNCGNRVYFPDILIRYS